MKELLLVETDERAPQRLRQKALDIVDALVENLNDTHPKTIHDTRRRLKELRALTLLLGGGKTEERFFRDGGRLLSGARDAKAALEAFDRLRDRFATEWTPKQFAKIRRALAARVDQSVDLMAIDNLRNALKIERGKVAAWPVDEMRRDKLLQSLSRSYRSARKAMKRALRNRTNEAIHAWRKRVKAHGYHAQFLTAVNLTTLDAHVEALRKLSRALGHRQDLLLIDDICRHAPESLGSSPYVRRFQTFIARESIELLTVAEAAGREVFAERPRNWAAQREYARRAGTSTTVHLSRPSKTTALSFPP